MLAGGVDAGASSRAKVSAGDYQAVLEVPPSKNYEVGVFSVERHGAKRQIVASDRFAGIFYPDDGACDDFDVPLSVESIPVSRTGRFQIQEKTPVAGTSVRVSWKGHWTAPGVIAGSVTIKHDGCKSTNRWRGGKVATSATGPLPD